MVKNPRWGRELPYKRDRGAPWTWRETLRVKKDPVLCAWLKLFSSLKQTYRVIFFRLITPAGTAKVPCGPFEAEDPKK